MFDIQSVTVILVVWFENEVANKWLEPVQIQRRRPVCWIENHPPGVVSRQENNITAHIDIIPRSGI